MSYGDALAAAAVGIVVVIIAVMSAAYTRGRTAVAARGRRYGGWDGRGGQSPKVLDQLHVQHDVSPLFPGLDTRFQCLAGPVWFAQALVGLGCRRQGVTTWIWDEERAKGPRRLLVPCTAQIPEVAR